MKKTKEKRSVFVRLTNGYLYLMLAAFPLLCGAGGYQTIGRVKFSGFCVLCGGYVLLMLLLALEGRIVGGLRWKSPQELLRASNAAQRFALAYLGLTWLSALCSDYYPQTILGVSRNEGALTIGIYCLCFLLVSAFARPSRGMLYAAAASVFIFSALCIVQFYGGNPFTLYPAGYGYADGNIAYAGEYLGTIGNVDLVAAYLCLAIPALLFAALRLRGRERAYLLSALAVALFVLVKMRVLAGLVGVFCGTALSLPFALSLTKKRRRAYFLLLALAALATLALLYCADIGGGLWHEIHEILRGRVSDAFGSGRIYIWRSVLRLVPGHLLLGTGPDTMLLAGIEPFSRFDETLGIFIKAQIDTAHNEYLNILFHQGLPALLAYLGVLLASLCNFFTKNQQMSIAIAGGAVVSYNVQGIFGLGSCAVAPIFWIMLAILNSHKAHGGKEQ